MEGASLDDRARDRLRSQLTDLLMRAPRRPGGALFEWAVELFPEVAEWIEEPPVLAVGTTPAGAPLAVVLMTREAEVDVGRLSEALQLDFPIEVRPGGENRPAARPAVGGESISGDGAGGDTGTLSCLVQNDKGDRLVLGCNHVLAGVNRGVLDRDVVLQPGAADGGDKERDTLGRLVHYQPIQLGGYFENRIDAAIAEPYSPTAVDAGIRELGGVEGLAPRLYHRAPVRKVGWQTDLTSGLYELDVSCTLTFGDGEDALFVNQYGIFGDDPDVGFAQKGDSGGPVLTEAMELAGIVTGIRDGSNLTYATPIRPVLEAFEVQPVY